jgi:hypothetical protein
MSDKSQIQTQIKPKQTQFKPIKADFIAKQTQFEPNCKKTKNERK